VRVDVADNHQPAPLVGERHAEAGALGRERKPHGLGRARDCDRDVGLPGPVRVDGRGRLQDAKGGVRRVVLDQEPEQLHVGLVRGEDPDLGRISSGADELLEEVERAPALGRIPPRVCRPADDILEALAVDEELRQLPGAGSEDSVPPDDCVVQNPADLVGGQLDVRGWAVGAGRVGVYVPPRELEQPVCHAELDPKPVHGESGRLEELERRGPPVQGEPVGEPARRDALLRAHDGGNSLDDLELCR